MFVKILSLRQVLQVMQVMQVSSPLIPSFNYISEV